MLFKPEHVNPILEGRKTQTRRIWKRRRAKPGSHHWAQTGMYKPETRFACLEVLRVWQEPLINISEADAKAEGYQDSHEYLMAFVRINRLSWGEWDSEWIDGQREVWCVEFKLCPPEEAQREAH